MHSVARHKESSSTHSQDMALRLLSFVQHSECNPLERLELEHIISSRQIQPVFQPIVSLRDGSVHGHESLSRLTHRGSITNPEELFDKARKHGLTSSVENLCRDKALTHASRIGLQGMIFLNVCPALLHTEEHRRGYTANLLDQLGLERSRVVFELTEKSLIDDYALFEKGVAHYRSQGYKIAIDDLGDGYAGLKMLSQVTPDYVKLAGFLITDIDSTPIKQALVEAILCFSKKIGIKVIAEGIERQAELDYLADIGVDFGQGYLLARPSADPAMNSEFTLPKPASKTTACFSIVPCRLTG